MKRVLALLAAGALGVATASADIIVYSFPIEVDQEVPAPNIPPDFTPSGTGMVTIDTDTNLLSWEISYSGLTGEILAPGAHFHGPADFGVNAGIQVFLSDGDPPEPASGALVGSTTIDDTQEQQLLDGLWYVNLHTELNGAGEIRGQVVPEPGALALLLVAAPFARRRR